MTHTRFHWLIKMCFYSVLTLGTSCQDKKESETNKPEDSNSVPAISDEEKSGGLCSVQYGITSQNRQIISNVEVGTTTQKSNIPVIHVASIEMYYDLLWVKGSRDRTIEESLVNGWALANVNEQDEIQISIHKGEKFTSLNIYWLPYKFYRKNPNEKNPTVYGYNKNKGSFYSTKSLNKSFDLPYSFDMEEVPVFAIEFIVEGEELPYWTLFDLRGRQN